MTSLRNQIDEIKSKIKISEEISKHIQLVQKGNDLWSLCFFHNEKTPSMKINDELSSYYCFGCGAKGDLLTFYMLLRISRTPPNGNRPWLNRLMTVPLEDDSETVFF